MAALASQGAHDVGVLAGEVLMNEEDLQRFGND
jgi:hypothetical protein